MHEKNAFIACFMCLWLFTLSGCCTRAGIRDNRDGAYTVREHIGELKDKQTESVVTGERLNGTLESAREKSESLSGELTGSRENSEHLSGELTGSRENSEHLTQSITDGAGELDIFDGILQQIRERYVRDNSGKASPN